jgi:hypothetical protein
MGYVMADLDLRGVRDQIGSTVRMPSFDEVLAAGRRRRRARIGAAFAAVVLLLGGGAVALGQPSGSDRGIEPADVRPTAATADQIIDAPDAELWDYVLTGTGVAYSFWHAPCIEFSCPTAVAWSDDGWESRVTSRIPPDSDWQVSPGGLLVLPAGRSEYLVTPDGTRVDLRERRQVLPATGDEMALQDIGTSAWRLVDPRTGESRPAPLPPGTTVDDLGVMATGDMEAVGTLRNGNRVLAGSTDGGVTWSRIPLPASSGWVFRNGTHIALMESLIGSDVSPPIRVTVSADAGESWTAREGEEVPFGVSDCMTATSDALVVTAGGQLWRSTDDAWLHFEQLTDAPELACVGDYDGTLVSPAAEGRSAWVSTDVGDTWTEVDPR